MNENMQERKKEKKMNESAKNNRKERTKETYGLKYVNPKKYNERKRKKIYMSVLKNQIKKNENM